MFVYRSIGENPLIVNAQNVLPPTLNLDTLSEGFDCNYVPKEAQQQRIDVTMSNSFGFGGTNSSLCFARYGG